MQPFIPLFIGGRRIGIEPFVWSRARTLDETLFELAKLALTAGPDGKVSAQEVQQWVGGWRARTTWEMLDAVLAGNANAALTQLDQLILAGENPTALLGQISFSLRRTLQISRAVFFASAEFALLADFNFPLYFQAIHIVE